MTINLNPDEDSPHPLSLSLLDYGREGEILKEREREGGREKARKWEEERIALGSEGKSGESGTEK